MDKKKLFLGIVVVLVGLLVLGLVYAAVYSPKGTLKDYLKSVEKGKTEAAQSYLAEGDETDKRFNYTEDWSGEDTFKYKIIKGESWKEKEGKFKPYFSYLAGYYKARVKITLEDSAKTYVITLRRKGTDNRYNLFSYVFKGWEVESIKKND